MTAVRYGPHVPGEEAGPAEPGEVQRTLVLTPHPLQRVGAYALVALVEAESVEAVTPQRFDAAVERMTEDAVNAALAESTRAEDGFWLKASGSFFPNAPMNHPSRGKRSRAEIASNVRAWRWMPEVGTWPAEPCGLCGRQACGFYGKMDVPLAPSTAYRNTVPTGHDGLPLCWACLCSFYALPYGCALTGGPSSAVHSWDEDFLRETTARRVDGNSRHVTLGVPVEKSGMSPEALAVRELYRYEEPLAAGVELLVFSNDNREASLLTHSLDQPLAEWLRATHRAAARRRGFAALLRAHRTRDRGGSGRLAWNAFHDPRRVYATAVASLTGPDNPSGLLAASSAELVELCFSYVTKVLQMNDKDVRQIRALADNVATILAGEEGQGALKGYQAVHREPRDLRAWFKRNAVRWLIQAPEAGAAEGDRPPLITDEQWRLLFDPDGAGREHRDLLFIAVLQKLHEKGWRPADPEAAAELLDEPDLGPDTDEIDDMTDNFAGSAQ